MKKVTKVILLTYSIGLTTSILTGFITWYLTDYWELAVTLAVLIMWGFANDSVTSFIAYRKDK